MPWWGSLSGAWPRLKGFVLAKMEVPQALALSRKKRAAQANTGDMPCALPATTPRLPCVGTTPTSQCHSPWHISGGSSSALP